MERCFLRRGPEIYCEAVCTALEGSLRTRYRKSRGLLAFGDYLREHVASVFFRTPRDGQADKLKTDLSAIRYFACLLKMAASRFVTTVLESDYTASVEETFEKFRRSDVDDYAVKTRSWEGINHIQAEVLDRE